MEYSSVDWKLAFSPNMQRVYDDLMERLQPYGAREHTSTGPDRAGGKNPFADVFAEMPDAPYAICCAHGIVRSWMESPFVIYPGEYVVVITRPFYPIMEHFSHGLQDNRWILDQPEFASKKEWEIERITRMYDRMFPLCDDYLHDAGKAFFTPEIYEAIRQDGLWWAGGYQGHTVPDYKTLLTLGLDGLLEKIHRCAAAHTGADEQAALVYQASEIVICGLSRWIEAYGEHAQALAQCCDDPVQRQIYETIWENCRFVAHQAPKTLYQAVQLTWFYALWDWVDCMGRVDQYLYPFYRTSMQEGDVVSPEDSIVSLMLKLFENGAHNITVSGQKEDGTDATNDLTYLMLQTIRRFHDVHPRMSVRLHKNSPSQLMRLVVQMWSEGMSDPSVVSDEAVIPGLLRLGVSLEDARDYTMLGCQEIEIPGKSNFGCEDGSFNLAKVLEYTLWDGYSKATGKYIGLRTGKLTDFSSFTDFYAAFVAQVQYFTKPYLELCNRGVDIRVANFSKMVKTPLTANCLERGLQHDAGGPIYNFGVIETAGVSAVADALTAIKKLVFEERKITAEELLDALDADFQGYEAQRQLLLHKAPKFGNDDPEADAMAVRVLDMFWSEIGKYKSRRGDVFTGACSLLNAGIEYGKKTGALPDGRFAGEPLGNSIGPRPGADQNGLTAMLASVAKLPLEKGAGGTTLNVVLTTKLLSTPDLRESIGAVLYHYLMHGGQMAQVTTANLEDLQDAKVHPERHGDLIIRIGGFSVQFVILNDAEQDEVISRYAGF